MDWDPIIYAVPVFFLLIGVELLVQWWTGQRIYRANDTMTNMSCGIVEQAVGLYAKLITVACYQLCYQTFSVWQVPSTWTNFFIMVVAVDFCYYWAHRMSHEVNVMWGAHIVHHQSEDYNLSVALRQGTFQTFWVSPFYLPLAVIGFNTPMYVGATVFVLLYQFWIHTETIGKLGWFEWIFNTPSHHRVHHGIEAKYIDRNHAGMLIIWDRMFGTFQEEEEAPTYGTTDSATTWNPLWVNITHYSAIWTGLLEAPNWRARRDLLFRPPGWTPENGQVIEDVPPRSKFDLRGSRALTHYLIVQYVTFVFGAFAVFAIQEDLSSGWRMLWVLFLLGSVAVVGALHEGRQWAKGGELVRLVATMSLAVRAGVATSWAGTAAVVSTVLTLGSILWFARVSGVQGQRQLS
jgi:alkylglycerol monooxygenase